MIATLVRAGIFLGTCAVALLLTALVLSDFRLSASGFIVAVIVFAVVQSVLAPLSVRLARDHASALLGGAGIIATFVALWVSSLFPGGLSITGAGTWVLATLIVWLLTALGTWLLPLVLLKKRAGDRAVAPPSA